MTFETLSCGCIIKACPTYGTTPEEWARVLFAKRGSCIEAHRSGDPVNVAGKVIDE